MAKPNSEVKNEFTPPTEDEQLVAWLDKKRENCKPRVSDMAMKMNLSFVLGQQWLVWDGQRQSFRRPAQKSSDPNAPIRLTFNKIAPLVEGNTARLVKNVPLPECRPVGGDDQDLDTAKVGSRMLFHECDRLSWDTLLADLYTCWVTPLGWSYLYVYWDPSKGDNLGEVDGEDVNEGNICADIAPAWEVRVDPNSMSPTLEDARYAFHTTSMSKEAIWEAFGVLPEGGEPGKTIADEVQQLVDTSQQNARADFYKVHRFWLRPGGRAHKPGMVVTWCGKTILEKKLEYPYDHGRLPFIQFNLLPGIGTREGRTWVTDLIPIQTDYNDARSREAHIRRTMTPKLLSPVGSIDPNRINSRVEVIPYRPSGQQPNWLMPDSRALNQHEMVMNRADAEMRDRAGSAEVSSGNAPSSMPAAAILALQEADDTKLALSAKHLARGIEEFGRQVLSLIRQFWDDERCVRTWSEDNTLQVDHFMGADLATNYDVHVSAESALPKSKAARTQLAIDLWTQGVITDPHTYVTMLDIPGTDFLQEQMSYDKRRAVRENDKLRQGEPAEVYHWDDHQIHLAAHNEFRKSIDYEELDEEQRTIFDAHCAIHEGLLLGQQSVPNGVGADPEEGPVPGAPTFGDPVETQPAYMNAQGGLNSTKDGEPSPLDQGDSVAQAAGIGGPGEPGHVPGVSSDEQAARMGR